jgi:hypothetical protein
MLTGLFCDMLLMLVQIDKIRFYCQIKVPARGRIITVIYITKNILIYKCNKQYTNKQFAEIRLVNCIS